jgi:polar amino acid transport system substrate-binding protein
MKGSTIVPRRTFCLFIAAFGLLMGCQKPDKGEELVVGMDLSYPPFETIDEKGQPTGISVEIAQGLADSLHKHLRIENIPFTGLIPTLQKGNIDCVISSLTANEERRKSIDFSEPYLKTGLALLVRKDSSITDAKTLDLPGRTVAVRQGTTGEAWAKANLKQARVLTVEKENSAVLEVVQGKADAFIYDQMSVWKNWQNNRDTTKAILAPLHEESWAVGLRRGNDELKSEVNTFIDQFRKSGGFDKLGDKYLKDQKEAFKEQGIPFYF